MKNFRGALVLLSDLEEFADIHEFPKAENLIAKARLALEKDLDDMFSPIRKSPKSSHVYMIQ